MTKEKTIKISAGGTGEYFLAEEFSSRANLTIFTQRNTKGADVLGTNVNEIKPATIQVKTKQ